MVDDEGFVLELTGAEASKKNGIAESPNRVYAQMMRCALYSSGLGPEYWSYALRMSVYVKNRLPHKSISCTPFKKLTGKIITYKNFGTVLYFKVSYAHFKSRRNT